MYDEFKLKKPLVSLGYTIIFQRCKGLLGQLAVSGWLTQSPENAIIGSLPINMRHWPDVGLLLGPRRRRWVDSKPTMCQRLMLAVLLSLKFKVSDNY